MLTKLLRRDSMTGRSLKGFLPTLFSISTLQQRHFQPPSLPLGKRSSRIILMSPKSKNVIFQHSICFHKIFRFKIYLRPPPAHMEPHRNWEKDVGKIMRPARVKLHMRESFCSVSPPPPPPRPPQTDHLEFHLHCVHILNFIYTVCATPHLRDSHRINWDDQGNIKCAHYSNN